MTSPKTNQTNAGRFRKGHDPRRHTFTKAECQAGFWRALESIAARYPDAVDAYGRHMAVKFLRRKSAPNH
jgi:hypothetical protein